MVKIAAFAVVAAVFVVASPASAQPHHKAVAHQGHNNAVVVDPNGFHSFALVPGDPPAAESYDPERATTRLCATIFEKFGADISPQNWGRTSARPCRSSDT